MSSKQHEMERRDAIHATLERNPFSFKPKICGILATVSRVRGRGLEGETLSMLPPLIAMRLADFAVEIIVADPLLAYRSGRGCRSQPGAATARGPSVSSVIASVSRRACSAQTPASATTVRTLRTAPNVKHLSSWPPGPKAAIRNKRRARLKLSTWAALNHLTLPAYPDRLVREVGSLLLHKGDKYFVRVLANPPTPPLALSFSRFLQTHAPHCVSVCVHFVLSYPRCTGNAR